MKGAMIYHTLDLLQRGFRILLRLGITVNDRTPKMDITTEVPNQSRVEAGTITAPQGGDRPITEREMGSLLLLLDALMKKVFVLLGHPGIQMTTSLSEAQARAQDIGRMKGALMNFYARMIEDFVVIDL